ncbi:MAG: class I SAM-dependent methyltransferase [Kineosporiaceae bacterium]
MTTTHPHAEGHGHGHGHGAQPTDFSTMIDYLDLDGEVFAEFHARATGAVEQAVRDAGGSPVRRIADLGCGTGTHALALARLFPEATMLAVDASQPLLEHLAARAQAEGLADRIETLAADLDAAWPASLAELDVVWASTSIHHLADPPAGLRAVRSSLVPGGLLALVEVDDLDAFHPSFLPGGLDRRLRASLAEDWRAMMPLLGADWSEVLADAGFEVVADRTFDVTITEPASPAHARAVTRFAELSLIRLREQLRDSGRDAEADPADLADLDAVLSRGFDGREDLRPATRRRLYLARPA